MFASFRSRMSARPKVRKSRLALSLGTMVAMIATAFTMIFLQAPPASAHCDSRTGPVVTAAKKALDTGDVKLILPYVKADQEKELTMAFEQTQAIRNRGQQVKTVADEYFFETAVRLHRVGEGASYTGIKDHAEASPALDAAEESLKQGKADEVIDLLDKDLRSKVAARFQGVLDARAAEKANPAVDVVRKRVEAELMFEKYVLEISGAIDKAASHEGEAGAAEGDGHGH